MAPDEHSLSAMTVLFADISASTRLYAERGDAVAFSLATRCLGVVEAHVRAVDGCVRKRLGDGLLATCAHPGAALYAAIGARAELVDPSATLLQEGVHIRFGISHGAAVDTGTDVFGDAVNVAARLQGLAGVDEILLAAEVYELLPPDLRSGARPIDKLTLRNRPGSVLVYRWVGEEVDATVGMPMPPRAAATTTLEIRHGDRLFVVGPARPRLTIGRQATHDISLDHESISRTHAELVMRGDRFVLVDCSTNGTYVHVHQGPTLRVLRDEVTLPAAGRILPGLQTNSAIEFRIAVR